MSADAPLFHVCAGLLQPGAQIQPGNWGKVVLSTGPAHNCYFRELVFEHGRERAAPDVPSRMACAFAFETFDTALVYRQSVPTELIYEVTVDPSAATYRVDMAWVTLIRDCRSFDAVEEVIRRYWSGGSSATPTWEILVDGPLIIGQRLTVLLDDQLSSP